MIKDGKISILKIDVNEDMDKIGFSLDVKMDKV